MDDEIEHVKNPNRVEAGKRAAAKHKLKYGLNYHENIGRAGGKKSRGGGFTGRPDIAAEYGSIGGKKSRRRKVEADGN